MLHLQIREARIAHGLTQSKLARLAGVPRTRLRELEDGGNVTLETLRKVLAQLPNLRSVSLGIAEMHTGHVDRTAARQILIDLITAAGRALALFENTPAPPPPPSGATLHTGGTQIEPELEQRLRALEAVVRGAGEKLN